MRSALRRVSFAAFVAVVACGSVVGQVPSHRPPTTPTYTRLSQRRLPTLKIARAQSDLEAIYSALDTFRLDCDRYPTTTEGLAALVRRPRSIPAVMWKGPYISMHRPLDPWRHPYIYRAAGDNPDLFSAGGEGSGVIRLPQPTQ